jgi:hypothetical protein
MWVRRFRKSYGKAIFRENIFFPVRRLPLSEGNSSARDNRQKGNAPLLVQGVAPETPGRSASVNP